MSRQFLKNSVSVYVVATTLLWAQGAAAEASAASPTTSKTTTAPVVKPTQAAVSASAVNDASGLEDIVVTARKVTERLQDAAVSVTMLSGTTLESRNMNDLSETTKLASSMKFDSDSDVRASVAIRGVGATADVNASPGVGMFIDGVYQPSSAFFTVPFFDVQRIEILKGPQGTLYGKNTLGGAISIISRDPVDTLGANFSVSFASAQEVVANGVLNIPIAGDKLGNRTAVFYRNTLGSLKNQTTGDGANERNDFAIRSRFVFTPSENFKSALAFFYADLQAAPFWYSATNKGLNDPIDNVTKNINGQTVSKYKDVNWLNAYDFGAATLTSLTSYDVGNVDTLADGDFVAISALRVGGVKDQYTFAQELRLASSPDRISNFAWLIGGYYANDVIHSNSLTEAAFPVVGFRPLSIGKRRETDITYALFGQGTFVTGNFEFVAGVRYDDETKQNSSSSKNGLTGVTTFFDDDVTSHVWQPKVSVSYHFTPDVMLYGLATRGFRAGGFNALTAPPQYASYDPEFTNNYESGLRTEFLDQRLRLNATVFYTSYTDILQTNIVRGTDGSQTVVSINGGKAKSYGFEFETAFKVSKEWTLSGGYTYLNIKNDVIPVGLIRREVSGYSPNVFNAQANYLHVFENQSALGAHASVSYVGPTPMGTEIEWRNGYATVDASLDYTIGIATFSVFGKNIFDTQYYTSYVPRASTATRTSSLGQLNAPAQYGFKVSAAF